MGSPTEYIASQGPTTVILADFWRMVCEVRAGKIVMLSNLVEGGQKKVEKYWPDEGSQTYGSVTVTLLNTEEYADYVIRAFSISSGSAVSIVHQFHFLSWPDHGVPEDTVGLLEFRGRVDDTVTELDGPIIVHCSAGAGRTGTYIALDKLLLQASDCSSLSIYPCVTQIRDQRAFAIQSVGQYIFLHRALADAVSFTDSNLRADDFLRAEPSTAVTRYTEEYERLETMRPRLDKSNYHAATSPENIHKNKDTNYLAADKSRVFLSRVGLARTDYINAMFIPTLTSKRGLICTQIPLHDTVTDFWTLIYEQGSKVIIMLNGADTSFFLPDVGNTLDNLPFKVTTEKKEMMGSLVYTELILNNKERSGDNPRKLTHVHLKAWPDTSTAPPSADAIFSLMSAVETLQGQLTGEAPLVVQCRTGYERSGFFSCAWNVLSRLSRYQRVSVMMTVQQLRGIMPQVVSSLEHYCLLYELAEGYLKDYHTYSNYA